MRWWRLGFCDGARGGYVAGNATWVEQQVVKLIADMCKTYGGGVAVPRGRAYKSRGVGGRGAAST